MLKILHQNLLKSEAFKMKFCEIACGLWCNRSGKCNGDLFKGEDEEGNPITEVSKYCRVSKEDIETFKTEYNYNPITNRIYKRDHRNQRRSR